MPIRSVFLSDQVDSFITAGVEEGRYSDASEAVLEGLRLLQQRDAEDRGKSKWLGDAIKIAVDEIDRGEGLEFTSIDDLAEHIGLIGEEASEEISAGTARG